MKSHKTPKGTDLPILNLRGKEYLEVKYRIVWFREDHPDWSIETEYIRVEEQAALARAVIRNEQGRIMATSHKFENMQGFGDFLEKAETGAIGRALALVGYGTQFAGNDLDEGDRIVDAPVARATPPIRSAMPMPSMDEPPPPGFPGFEPYAGLSPVESKVGDFRINFGKFKGKRLTEVGATQLKGYVMYLEDEARKENKPISGIAKTFIEKVAEYTAK